MNEDMKRDHQKLENCDADKSEEILLLDMTELTPILIERARNELNETDEVKQTALAELRRMIEAEKNLVSRTDDVFLLAFLRSRYFDVKKAFILIQNFWKFRNEHSKIFDSVELESVISLMRHNFIGLLNYRDRQGCLILVAKVGLWDPQKDNQDNLFRAVSGILINTLENEANQIAGYRIIMDLRGLGWAQIKHMTPSNMMLVVRSTQFSFPARYKGIHVLTDDKKLNFLWGLIYPFLTKELKKLILFHGEDLSPLSQFIHPSVLPEEFGGQAPPFDNSSRIERIICRSKNVMSQLNYGYKD